MTINLQLSDLQWAAFCSLVTDRMTDPDPERTREWIRADSHEVVFIDELMTLLMEAEETASAHG